MVMPTDRPIALVTGGAKRVGRAIVQRLTVGGFDVVFTYLSSRGDAEELSRQCHAQAIRADLTQPPEAVAQIVNAISPVAARVAVLVNSASIYEPASLEQTDLVLMRRMMAIHYESPLLLSRALAGSLRQTRGHIVNMIDLLAERPWPQYLAYSASKAALANLTLSLARELAPEVTVNGIAPGVVEWPADYPEAERQKYLQRVPLARAGTPQDVANLVYFLAAEGSYITGQVLRLDGGRSIA